ncbi:hypothetical protein R1sor_009553 [Riccia sorocarpa]|uniref:SWIM-type domain-containing protein n=1 Tax=Riccia sorocarpa TaxID=122646 RepID=A0ABD3HVF1_9MARC
MITKRYFVCHCEGKPAPKESMVAEKSRKRPSRRCQCLASISIGLSITTGKEDWVVQKHVVEHNHPLLTVEEVGHLSANRFIPLESQAMIKIFKKAGICVSEMVRFFKAEKDGAPLTFTAKDIYNFLDKDCLGMDLSLLPRRGDAMEVIKALKDKAEKDPKFFYQFTVDEDGRLEHLMWVHSQARSAARLFADVVLFDTTYKMNRYEMPFGVFVGVNNHGQSILLGACLLRNETIPSFSWVFKNWLSAMGRSPVSILTDQDKSMREAIEVELPETKHAFCMWHIMRKFPHWFAGKLTSRYQDFIQGFYLVLHQDTIQAFEESWSTLIESYGLRDDTHISDLFLLRDYWAPAFLRPYFFAGLSTTQRSESINAFMNGYMGKQTSLVEFVEAFDRAFDSRADASVKATGADKLFPPSTLTSTRIEKKAQEKLTAYSFNLFQKQLVLSNEYIVEGSYIFHYDSPERRWFTRFSADTDDIWCICQEFQFKGILCRHALKALIHHGVMELPDKYLPERWCQQPSIFTQRCSNKQAIEANPVLNLGSEGELWRKTFMSKATCLASSSVAKPELRQQLDQDINRMMEYTMSKSATTVDETTTTEKQTVGVSYLDTSLRNNSVLIDKAESQFGRILDIDNPPVVVTKGRPKGKRQNTSTSERQPRLCRACNKMSLHDSRNCPSKNTS